MAERGGERGAERGGDRGGFGRGFGGGRGDRGGRGGPRGRGGRRGGRPTEEEKWTPVTKLGRLVQAGKIQKLEQIYLHSLPVKEYQIIDLLVGPTLKDEVMKIMPVQKQTRAGQRTRFKAFVVVGDTNGHVGLGVKCSKEVATAIRGGIILAKLSVIPVRRGYWGNKIGKPHTVPCKVTGKCGSVTVRMVPAPRGAGIVAARVPKKVLQFAGIDDVFTSSRGSTKTLGNFVKATFDCLQKTYGFLTPEFWKETSFKKSPYQEYTDLLAEKGTKKAITEVLILVDGLKNGRVLGFDLEESCACLWPLFSSGFLRTVQALLDQTRQVEMQIVGFKDISMTDSCYQISQTDGSSLFSLEGILSKLCQLALEVEDDDRSRSLRAAGLQALSAMIWLMGEYCHIPSDFDNVVSGVLENYGHPKKLANAIDNARKWVDEVLKNEGHLAHADSLINVPSWRTAVNDKGELNVKMEDSLDPSFWSKVCLHNMAKLGEDATTMRRILESLFRYFDEGHLWSTENSIALPVLRDLQFLMELSGQRTHFILSMLIKHVDHKSVLKQPSMQLNILEVTSSLAENAKVEHSAAIVSAISDIMRHLRKCMHSSLHEANLGTEAANCNRMVSVAIDKCLIQLTKKVGDAGPILDAMALMLENIPAVTDVARNTIASVFRTAQIIASAFPEALFHQLLKAMVHPDHKTRIGAHRIFSVVLVPTSVCPHPSSTTNDLKKGMGLPRSLSRTASVFSSSTALFEKLRKENISSVPTSDQRQIKMLEEESGINSGEILDRLTSSYSQVYRSWNQPVTSVADNSELDAVCIRLSSHQIGLLLSSIWAQSISANTPDNYEAITNTYRLVLLFSRGKLFVNISKVSYLSEFKSGRFDSKFPDGTFFARCFFNGRRTTPSVPTKVTLHYGYINDQLQTVAYGCQKDDASALDTLSNIAVSTEHSRGALVYEISGMEKIQEQLLSDFMPDDACPLGTIVLEDTQKPFQADFGDVKPQNLAALFSHEDQESGDVTETAADDNPVTVAGIPDLLTVDQISRICRRDNTSDGSNILRYCSRCFIQRNDVSFSVNGSPPQHDEEIKIATFHPMINFHAEDDVPLPWKDFDMKSPRTPMGMKSPRTLMGTIQTQCYSELQNSPHAYKLPASTPYDNFLKAAGC
ncbi:hypothetical protein Bca4012_028561 [Brassica carinata]